MKTSTKILLPAAFAMILGACSDSETSAQGFTEETQGIAYEKLAGVCEKGPLMKGSKVHLYELDSETNTKTGKDFETSVISDKGDYLFKDVSLKNPVALFEGNGYYTDDITGKKSKQKATLYALADVSETDFVNMNLFTTFEYKRILYLMSTKSMSFEKAQKKASEEVLAALKAEGSFNNMENTSIFGSSDENAYLFAISVLLETVAGNDNIDNLIEEICDDLEEDGSLDDVDLLGSFKKNLDSLDLKAIRKNLEKLDMGKIPEFEEFVCSFAGEASSKIKGCAVSYTVGGEANEIAVISSSSAKETESDKVESSSSSSAKETESDKVESSSSSSAKETESDKVESSSSSSKEKNKDDAEVESTSSSSKNSEAEDEAESSSSEEKKNLCGNSEFDPIYEECVNGKIQNLYKLKTYVENGDVYVKVVKKSNNQPVNDLTGCSYKASSKTVVFNVSTTSKASCAISFTSTSEKLIDATISIAKINDEAPMKDHIFAEPITLSVTSGPCMGKVLADNQFCDNRDGHVYGKTSLGKQTWMTENLNYYDESNPHLKGHSACYGEDDNICTIYGRLYDWYAAMDVSYNEQPEERGICPEGWHVPSNEEFQNLANHFGMRLSPYGQASLKDSLATVGLEFPLAGGGSYDEDGRLGFSGIGSNGYYWGNKIGLIDGIDKGYAQALFVYGPHAPGPQTDALVTGTRVRASLSSIRCIMDSDKTE